jgi:hypothetical protein
MWKALLTQMAILRVVSKNHFLEAVILRGLYLEITTLKIIHNFYIKSDEDKFYIKIVAET